MHTSSIGCEHREAAIRIVPETDDVVAVCLEGNFDLTNARTLEDEVDGALETGGSVILDLSEASFIDSSVIHVIVRASRRAREHERVMVLQLGTAAIVERVLQIADIEQVLPRAHDRQEAVRIIQRHDAI